MGLRDRGSLRLTVLGSCGSYPSAGRACSSYLVRSGRTAVMLDAGSGSLANLQHHLDIADLDAVVISHEHPDHWIDTTGLHVAAKYYLGIERLPVLAPRSVGPVMYYAGPPFELRTVADGDRHDVGDLTLTFSRTDHPVETLAVRVDGAGSSIAYSADTGPAWSLAALGPGVDLALCEATFLAADEGRAAHLSARQAGAMAREAGAGRLVLTHIQPGNDHEAARAEAEATFGRPVEIAVEHMEIQL